MTAPGNWNTPICNSITIISIRTIQVVTHRYSVNNNNNSNSNSNSNNNSNSSSNSNSNTNSNLRKTNKQKPTTPQNNLPPNTLTTATRTKYKAVESL